MVAFIAAWALLVAGASSGQMQEDPVTKQLREFFALPTITYDQFIQTYSQLTRKGVEIPAEAMPNLNVLRAVVAARTQSEHEFLSALATITKDVPLHRRASGYSWLPVAFYAYPRNYLQHNEVDRQVNQLLLDEKRPFFIARFRYARAMAAWQSYRDPLETAAFAREALVTLDAFKPEQSPFYEEMYIDIFNCIASSLQIASRYTQANATLREALDRISKMQSTPRLEQASLSIHFGLGANYHYLGDLTSARAEYELCVNNITKMEPEKAGQAASSYTLLLANLREFDLAERQLKTWIPLAIISGQGQTAMFLHVVQLYVQWRQNDMAGLAEAHRALLKYGQSRPDLIDYPYHAGDAFAQLYLAPSPRAVESAKKAEDLLALTPYNKHKAIVQGIRGRAELELGQLDDAHKTLSQLEREFERMSEDVSDPAEVGLFQQTLPHLHGHIALLHHKRNKPNEALFALERGRGWGIARQSRLNYAVRQSDILTEEQRQGLSDAEQAVRRAQSELRAVQESKPTLKVEEVKRAEAKVLAARNRLNNVWDSIYLVSADLRPKNKNLDLVFQERELNALQNKHPDTLFVHVACIDERESLAILSAKGIPTRTHTIKVGEGDMIKKVRAYLAAMGAGPGRAGSATSAQASFANELALSKELYVLLLAPILENVPQADRFKRIVVVTDGPFGEIPFAALAIDDKTRVVDRYAVSSAVSLASLLWIGGSETPSRGLLAVADPTGSISAEVDKSQTRSSGYGPLPGAREEGEKIIDLIRDHTLLVGHRAQESLIKRVYNDYDILHFACHGLLDSGTPLSNGLVLARNDEEDGILEVREIMVKVLSARLAVLSACDSAVGFHNGGDGVQSLVWAFLAANCENVVASRWKVNDQATRDLMVAFYTGAQANEPFDLALQSAMKKIKADPRTASPYYWSAFDVFGKPGRGLRAQ